MAVGTTIAAAGVTALGTGAAFAAPIPAGQASDGTTAALAATVTAPSLTVHLDATGSTPGVQNAALHYTFHCNAADTIVPKAVAGHPEQADCTFPSGQNVAASVDVWDTAKLNAGNVATATATAYAGVPKAGGTLAVIKSLAQDAVKLDTANVDLTGSFVDAANKATGKATLNWGDGATDTLVVDPTSGAVTDATPAHTYASGGLHNVTLSVSDGIAGATPATATSQVTVYVSPVVVWNLVQGTGQSSMSATLDLAGTKFDPSVWGTASGTINWGDGTAADNITVDSKTGKITVPAAHAYAAATAGKAQIVTLTLLEKPAGTPITKQTTFTPTVPGAPHAPNVTGFAVTAGTTALTAVADVNAVTFDTTAVAANETYSIDWKDGHVDTFTGATIPTGGVVTHAYAAAGTYAVTLSVNDGLNIATSAASTSVNVTLATTTTKPDVFRASGVDRYDTGLILSRHRWASASDTTVSAQKAGAVVLATGNAFPDALSGVPLAAHKNGPLLLTDGKAATADPRVITEIQRVIPKDAAHPIYILGGTTAVSSGIEGQLSGLGYTVIRYGGADRFATSLQIAQQGMGDPAHLVVARGDEGIGHNGFADALAAGPFAADVFGGGNSAVILTDNTKVTPAISAYIQSKLGTTGAANVVAVGGPAVSAVASIPGAPARAAAITGGDRYDTARNVAKFFPAGSKFGVATGLAFPDALTGGAVMASIGGPLILTDPVTESPAAADAISRLAASTPQGVIFGGLNAISASTFNNIVAAVKGNGITWTF